MSPRRRHGSVLTRLSLPGLAYSILELQLKTVLWALRQLARDLRRLYRMAERKRRGKWQQHR